MKTSDEKLAEKVAKVRELVRLADEEEEALREKLADLELVSRYLPKPVGIWRWRKCPTKSCRSKVTKRSYLYGLFHLYQCTVCDYEYVVWHPAADG